MIRRRKSAEENEHRKISRRKFLTIGSAAGLSLAAGRTVTGTEFHASTANTQLHHLDGWDYQPEDIRIRFLVGGDPHYGWGENYVSWWKEWVDWMNTEKQERGVDLLFLNGDIVHDRSDLYERIQSDHLSQLAMPYYAIKGNHDFLAPDQTWEGIWGHPSNHIVRSGDFAFILADTSIGINDRNHYSAASHEWLAKALDSVRTVPHVFVIMHIAQRKEGVEVDGYQWPQYGVGHQGHEDTEQGEKNMAMIESHDMVRAIFHSHNHRKVDRYMSGGKPYFFCGRLGGSLLRGTTLRGYRVVECYKDGAIATYQWNLEEENIMTAHWIQSRDLEYS